jgi:hypothetical protein
MLTEVQAQFPEDSDLYTTLGSALLAGRQYGEAVQAFVLAVRFDPRSSPKERRTSTRPTRRSEIMLWPSNIFRKLWISIRST